MPNYYNPYMYAPNMYASYGYPVQQAPVQQANPAVSGNSFMTSVDGEMAARAWQPPTQLGPNTIVPLWDLDGQHVYFKSTDAYGRMNPIRKGRVVFDDESANLPEGMSGAMTSPSAPDMSQYVTKEDFNALRSELRDFVRNSNQNGRRALPEQHSVNRGDSR